jgi:RNA polymerase sigma factor (sigma-70 family)
VMAPTDGQLLARFPEPDAVSAFYARHMDAVLRFAVHRCRSADDAADLVSVVFLRVFSAAASFDGARGRARPWLLGIAGHCLADLYRDGARRASLEQEFGARPSLEGAEYERVEQMIDAARSGARVEAALADVLTDREREMFLLVAADELSPAEAARSLGLAPVTGRMRLARARRKLKAALATREEPHVVPGVPDPARRPR